MSLTPRPFWSGFYFDGQSPRRREVSITLAPEGLHITQQDGTTLWWLYGQLRLPGSFQPGEPVRLEKKDTIGEAIVVPEGDFLGALRQFAPAEKFRQPAAAHLSARLPLLLLAAGALVMLAAGIYLWGIPALTRRAAAGMPLQWEERLGDAALDQLAPPEMRCSDAEQQKILDQIAAELMAAAPPASYRLQVLVVDNAMANAFAVPGGRIVIFRGLLQQTDRAEEVAGVMAHEIEHVLLRHPVQAVLRQLSLQALAAVLAGDSSGMASALGAAGSIGGMRYQRGDEEAADRDAVHLLQAARIDPAGFIEILEKLQQGPGETPSALQYLSTHPLTANRIAELRRLAARPSEASVPLLPDVDWARLRGACAR